jgi:hypothetical protein
VIEGKVAAIIVLAYQSDYFGPREGDLARAKNLMWLCNDNSDEGRQKLAKAAAVAAINELLNGEWKVAACEVGAYFVPVGGGACIVDGFKLEDETCVG